VVSQREEELRPAVSRSRGAEEEILAGQYHVFFLRI
jgi:hypothetical protein